MYSYVYMYWNLHKHMATELISLNMYGGFMNTKYLCTCMKTYGTNFEPLSKAKYAWIIHQGNAWKPMRIYYYIGKKLW